MKINSWIEVDGVENVSYRFQCAGICVGVRKKETNFLIAEVDTSAVSKMVVIDFLKLFGFSVEFEEPPKLSKKANNFVWGLDDDAWIAVDADGMVWVYRLEPYRCPSYTEWHCAHDDAYGLPHREPNLLFPFITWETRAWSVKELRELEVER